jgi:formylglycine-generating enzyme required for sulfatase activity
MVDAKTGRALSPYYPPSPRGLARIRSVWQVERFNLGDPGAVEMPLPDLPAWQEHERFRAKAVSRPGVVPQGYLTFYSARRACVAAGKRLCTEDEWVAACRGERDRRFPYGANYVAGRCNVFRAMHPAAVLHGSASVGLTDPRLNLVVEEARDPLLRLTGATAGCVSRWGQDSIYDMVGNLDEWVDDDKGVFVGGFYARMTTKGCEAKISSHAPAYYDYSTGTRCCQ